MKKPEFQTPNEPRGMTRFPNAALETAETVPRITPEHAAELIELIERMDESYLFGAAILVAVWTNKGALVKYLIDDQQARETIGNLRRALEKGER